MYCTLNNLGVTHYHATHDYDRAAESFEAALNLARAAGNRDTELVCCHNLAATYLRTGNIATAMDMCEDMLVLARQTENSELEAAALQQLGEANRRLCRYDVALSCFRQALGIRERIGAIRPQAVTHAEMAAVLLETGRLEPASEHCLLALDLSGRTRDEATRCDALSVRADVRSALGNPAEAARDGQEAFTIAEELGDSLRQVRALIVTAHSLVVAGETFAARPLCDQALGIVGELADPEKSSLRERLNAIVALLQAPKR